MHVNHEWFTTTHIVILVFNKIPSLELAKFSIVLLCSLSETSYNSSSGAAGNLVGRTPTPITSLSRDEEQWFLHVPHTFFPHMYASRELFKYYPSAHVTGTRPWHHTPPCDHLVIMWLWRNDVCDSAANQ